MVCDLTLFVVMLPSKGTGLQKSTFQNRVRFAGRIGGLFAATAVAALISIGATGGAAQGIVSASATQADAEASILANACTSCHGVDGRSQSAIPSIAGLDPTLFAQILTGFRDGQTTSTIMGRIVGAYSDEQFELLANYFAGR